MSKNLKKIRSFLWLSQAVRKLLFRTLFAYLCFYYFSFYLGLVPFVGLAEKYESLWHKIVPWAGTRIFHLSYSIAKSVNGSGDTAYDYFQLLCYFILAALVGGIWPVVNRNR